MSCSLQVFFRIQSTGGVLASSRFSESETEICRIVFLRAQSIDVMLLHAPSSCARIHVNVCIQYSLALKPQLLERGTSYVTAQIGQVLLTVCDPHSAYGVNCVSTPRGVRTEAGLLGLLRHEACTAVRDAVPCWQIRVVLKSGQKAESNALYR